MRGKDRDCLETNGCVLRHRAVADDSLDAVSRAMGEVHTGARLSLKNAALDVVIPQVTRIVDHYLRGARPVRALWFDKTLEANWAVPWHQDRTIAVRERVTHPGYGPWSIKAGTVHVEPPFAVLGNMVTARLHFDACPPDNAPLEVIIGSHTRRHAVAEVAALVRAGPQRLCLAAKGDLWLYRTPILHRSARATRSGRRRVLQVDFCRESLPPGLDWAE